jgi:2-polyprenyl-3-methyl-5-hydroxy-6-metoxy-1,4-benzoquinol methylase
MSQHRRSVSRRAGPKGCYESDVYRAFEGEHRGSRELIESRLRVYLPLVEPLKELCPGCRAVDFGCGPGEWLEPMGETGIQPHGIDPDDGMLAVFPKRRASPALMSGSGRTMGSIWIRWR